jgi:membrane-associated phospholipid phosphatase
LFFLIIHILVLNVDFTFKHGDLLVTNFLLPVKVVQDFLALVELGLLFGLFLLLRLELFIDLSNLSLQDFYLFVLNKLLIFKLRLHLLHYCFVRGYTGCVSIDFYFYFLDYYFDVELAITQFADWASQLV